MNPLRILVVTLDYPPPSTGGYGVMAADVCDELVRRGHDVTVLTGADDVARESAAHGPRVLRVLRTYYQDGECVYPPLDAAAAFERHNLTALDMCLRAHRPDVVSFWHMGAMSLNMISRAADQGFPIVFVVADDWLVYGTWADGWQRRFLDRFEEAQHHADDVARATGLPTSPPNVWQLGHVSFASDFTRTRALASAGNPSSRTSVIHPGLADAFFAQRASSFAWNDQLVWVGRLIESKGILTALRALSLLSERVHLRILGIAESNFLATVEQEIARHHLRERVSIAWVTRDQLPAEYAQACVTLFTSEIEHEAFGLVAAEAMACGSLVVSTAVGGNAEICRNEENCLTYQAGDSAGLAAQLRRLATDAKLRARLGSAALETARQLTLARQVTELERLFTAEIEESFRAKRP